MKPIFAQGPSQTTRVVLAIVLSIALMVVDHQFQQLRQIRSMLAFVTYPLQVLADLPVSLMRWIDEATTTREELQAENHRLREEILRARAELQKLEALRAENLHLRNLLDASYKVGDRILIAELSAVDLDPYRQQVVIDKGSTSGVFIGQPVLDANAVMGQVIQTTPFSSTVLLITDPSHSIPVQVLRNGLRTIALGTGRINELSLPYLPTNSDIQVGDKLVTSGLGGKFPAGYPVATVTRINRSPDNAFAEIVATPTAHLDRSREVLLVWPVPAAPVRSPAPDATPETPAAGTPEKQP
ncbi:rod shape-determining protein MreC [endosymbiont of unidentified scaly snail isolate Monju]|uniref:rod shape-determining protein MreC n=1 Tax=endosymbiont of unidentified scaly snail isolate Monju TaxID=1248727 RepID=UPI0011DD2584|nr:rod shape-determining protein MreC [endosymbiont of unidentified scaly snail isolate Monju]